MDNASAMQENNTQLIPDKSANKKLPTKIQCGEYISTLEVIHEEMEEVDMEEPTTTFTEISIRSRFTVVKHSAVPFVNDKEEPQAIEVSVPQQQNQNHNHPVPYVASRCIVTMVLPEDNSYVEETHNDYSAVERDLFDYIFRPYTYDQTDPTRNSTRYFLLYGANEAAMHTATMGVAKKGDVKLIQISGSVLGYQWHRNTSKIITEIFEYAADNQPCILFVDNIQYLCGINNETNKMHKSQFCDELDYYKKYYEDIYVVTATTTPWELNKRFLARLDKTIYVSAPYENGSAMMNEFRCKFDPYYINYIGDTDKDDDDASSSSSFFCCGLFKRNAMK